MTSSGDEASCSGVPPEDEARSDGETRPEADVVALLERPEPTLVCAPMVRYSKSVLFVFVFYLPSQTLIARKSAKT